MDRERESRRYGGYHGPEAKLRKYEDEGMGKEQFTGEDEVFT